jgi:hypothetical protein
MSNIDRQEVYYSESYFGKSSAKSRGATVFHEGLHLFFRGGHTAVAAQMKGFGVSQVARGSTVEVRGERGRFEFQGPLIGSKFTPYSNPDLSAALNIADWIASDCKKN